MLGIIRGEAAQGLALYLQVSVFICLDPPLNFQVSSLNLPSVQYLLLYSYNAFISLLLSLCHCFYFVSHPLSSSVPLALHFVCHTLLFLRFFFGPCTHSSSYCIVQSFSLNLFHLRCPTLFQFTCSALFSHTFISAISLISFFSTCTLF